jgi:hypothetical protein
VFLDRLVDTEGNQLPAEIFTLQSAKARDRQNKNVE